MTSATASPLVSPALLAQKLTDPELLVLDIRSAESAGRAAFETADVQGAVHSDYAADGWRVQTRGADCLLPNPDDFAELFGRLGIAPERHTVIVSAGLTPADFSAAARVYWTLKVAGHGPVSILDGGYASWVSANLPVTAGPSIPQGSWPTTKALVDGVVAGCFPQLYGALAGSPPDQVITL